MVLLRSRQSPLRFSNTHPPNGQYLDGAAVFGNKFDEIHKQFIPTRSPDEIMAYSMSASIPRTRNAPTPLVQEPQQPKRKRAAEAGTAAARKPPAAQAATAAGAAAQAGDTDVPAFLSCSKCGLVFVDERECTDHEGACDGAPPSDGDVREMGGRVFDDARECTLHIIRHQIETGSPVTAHDHIYIRAGDGGDENAVEFRPAPAPREAAAPSGPESAVMERVRSLCAKTVDPTTGLPSERITVMDDEETLYDFAVEVRASDIPGAGLGAFLTYLGARVLRPEAAARSSRLLRGCYVDETSAGDPVIPTRDTATAQTPDGRMMKVTVTGENLHYNDNYRYVFLVAREAQMLFVPKTGPI